MMGNKKKKIQLCTGLKGFSAPRTLRATTGTLLSTCTRIYLRIESVSI